MIHECSLMKYECMVHVYETLILLLALDRLHVIQITISTLFKEVECQ